MNINPSGWRPRSIQAASEAHETVTGNRGLMLEEPLIFEIGTSETCGVDWPPPRPENRAGGP